ncbi:hypothetical protein DQ04_01231170, partial [Trypanosoma grayi]|uniref:hypothetical protein n=1 Tax=Trypanosoma grayi TaxID=71804 RepID=UPI0004F444ED
MVWDDVGILLMGRSVMYSVRGGLSEVKQMYLRGRIGMRKFFPPGSVLFFFEYLHTATLFCGFPEPRDVCFSRRRADGPNRWAPPRQPLDGSCVGAGECPS